MAYVDTTKHKMTMYRVYLNSGGYDSMGSYYGHGQPIYRYVSDEGTEGGEFRAASRAEAKAHVRTMYPNATFYR